MTVYRKVEWLSALSLDGLKEEINKFFEVNTSHRWHLVSINEGDNRSHIAWLEYDNEED